MTEIKVKRIKGVTLIQVGNLVIKTDKINRYRYNDLRKKKVITQKDVFNILKKYDLSMRPGSPSGSNRK